MAILGGAESLRVAVPAGDGLDLVDDHGWGHDETAVALRVQVHVLVDGAPPQRHRFHNT